MNALGFFLTGFHEKLAKGNTLIGMMPGLRSGLPKAPSMSGKVPMAKPSSGITIASRATPTPLPTPKPSHAATPVQVTATTTKPPTVAPTGGGPTSRVTGRGVPSMAV